MFRILAPHHWLAFLVGPRLPPLCIFVAFIRGTPSLNEHAFAGTRTEKEGNSDVFCARKLN